MSPHLAPVPDIERSTLSAPAVPAVVLDDADVWSMMAFLLAIKETAHARRLSAFALLGAVLARLSASLHPNWCLPATVGSYASLNFQTALIAPSGIGKSSVMAVAREFLPVDGFLDDDGRSLGSGEGLAESYFGMVETGNGGTERAQVNKRILFVLDEGSGLFESGSRNGSTIFSALRSAINGETIGQANASATTTRVLKRHQYRYAGIMGLQPVVAGGLFTPDQIHAGTPQRFLFVDGVDPSLPDTPGNAPAPMSGWQPPETPAELTPFGLDEAIAAQIRAIAAAKVQTGVCGDELDSHQNLMILRIAALLMIANNPDDRVIGRMHWALAERIVAGSDQVRRSVIAAVRHRHVIDEREASNRSALRAVNTAERVATSQEAKAHQSAVRAISRKVAREATNNGKPWTSPALSRAVKGADRKLVDMGDVIDDAVSGGFLSITDGGYGPGSQRT